MVLADTNKVGLYVSSEGAWGETPSTPRMSQLRYTGESLSYTKQSVLSETIRDDRMRDQVALVGFDTEGDINYELSFFSFDDLTEGAFAGTWSVTVSLSGITFSMDSSDNSINDSANGFGVIPVGAILYISGFTSVENNGRFRVSSQAAGKIVLTGGTVVTEAAGDTVTIKSTGRRAAAGDIDAVAPNQITSVALNFTTLGLSVGQNVRLAGFGSSNNNGIFKITVLAANAITFQTSAITNEAPAGSIDLYARMLRNGIITRSFLIEKRFLDITQFQYFSGMRVGSMTMGLTAQEIITGAYSFMGKTSVASGTSIAGSNVSADVTEVLTASGNVGSLTKNGASLASALRSISFELNNNLRPQAIVGQLAKAGIGYGFTDITGTIEAYFEDLTLYTDLLQHSTVSLSWRTTDNAGNAYVYTLPKIYLMTGSPTAPSGNADVILPLEYAAVRDAATSCMVQLDALAA